MKNIDTMAIRKDAHRNRFGDRLLAFIYILGLIFSGSLGYLAWVRVTDDGNLTLPLILAFVILYIGGISLIGRLRRG